MQFQKIKYERRKYSIVEKNITYTKFITYFDEFVEINTTYYDNV